MKPEEKGVNSQIENIFSSINPVVDNLILQKLKNSFSEPRINILKIINKNDNLNMSQIALLCKLSQTATYKHLKILEKEGFIKLVRKIHSNFSNVVQITEEGKKEINLYDFIQKLKI